LLARLPLTVPGEVLMEDFHKLREARFRKGDSCDGADHYEAPVTGLRALSHCVPKEYWRSEMTGG
jgi:hypothetical protein